jgi:Zn-dependent peptidase ImmA (M78 family)
MIPKKIQVLNYPYSIIEKRNLARDSHCDGVCDATNKIILLDKDLHKDDKLRVLMHEIMHAIQFESGFCEVLDRQTQEILSETVAGFLTATINIRFKRS